MRSLSTGDERIDILSDFFDARINFICLDPPEYPEIIDTFEGSTKEKLEEELENFVQNVIDSQVNIDLEEAEISMPKVFQKYAQDFGGEGRTLQFVLSYMNFQHDPQIVLNQINNSQIPIKYT